uniref:Trimethyllysine dioxygenase, mitochondrial n=1 Tax=Clastoptera arizonana TaxID=38151 RepID=A0A1B6EFC3_9HEMI
MTLFENKIQISYGKEFDVMHYNYIWLRENCRCSDCYNSTTYQRNIHPLDILQDIRPVHHIVTQDTLHVTWNDNHVSTYNLDWLRLQTKNEKRPECILWSGDISDKVAFVPKQELKSQTGLTQLVRSLLEYGVGFVTQVSASMEATEEVVRKIGPPLHTFYGPGMWEFADSLDHLDTAYTNVALGAHTDTTYFIQPAGLQIFHCIQHDGEGGDTLLVDGFRAAEDVRLADPSSFNSLKRIATEFVCIDRGNHYSCCTPSLTFTSNGQLEMIRYNVYDRSSRIPGKQNEVDEFYKSLRQLGNAIKKKSGEFWFKLQPGTVVFINNWRVLHGRSAYTGRRKMTGCYFSMGNFLSKARLLKLIV